MAATAMDPVDIANILAQELLYQQVIPIHVADFYKIFHFYSFILYDVKLFSMFWGQTVFRRKTSNNV